MTDLTMGQRIAAQRKLRAMSQEALAEKLEISRQAVSKWESDAAIPEVDKLIALGRIFGVSVGWLLGTETESQMTGPIEPQPEESRKRRVWKPILGAVCALAVLGGMMLHYQGRINNLTAANAAAQSQLEALAEADRQIQTRLDEMHELLQKQEADGKILQDYGITGMYRSEDMTQVSMILALTPKVYLEEATATVTVTNPDGYQDQVQCTWQGGQYLAHITAPVTDGMQFRMILAGAESWQEELLNEWDPWLGQLGTIAGFHIDPADNVAQQTEVLPDGGGVYRFSAPIQPPYALPRSAQESLFDIRLVLYRNGELVWQEDWAQECRNPYGRVRMDGYLLHPEIVAELPEMASGDELRLEITAELAGGQEITSVLDRRTVE